MNKLFALLALAGLSLMLTGCPEATPPATDTNGTPPAATTPADPVTPADPGATTPADPGTTPADPADPADPAAPADAPKDEPKTDEPKAE